MGAFDDIKAPKGLFDDIVAPITDDTPWSEVFSRAPGAALEQVKAIPEATVKIAKGLGHAVANPTETYEGLKNADWGKIGGELKHDFLTEEGWKQAIGERPLTRMMDMSMVLAGPEALAARAATKAGATGLAKGINTFSKAHDPAAWAVGGTKLGLDKITRFGNAVLGEATGTGGKSLNLGYDAGLESARAANIYKGGLRTTTDPAEAVTGFERAVERMGTEKNAAYRADRNALKSDLQRLDWAPIYTALNKAERDFVGPFTTAPQAAGPTIAKMRDVIDRERWAAALYDRNAATAAGRTGQIPPGHMGRPLGTNPHIDPLGMDALKKSISNIAGDAATSEAKAAASKVAQAIGDQIKTRAPVYDKMMGDYRAASEAINAYKAELSIGKNPDQALRKLYAALRNNVTGNYERRWQLVSSLAEQYPEAREALYALAGQTNSKWTPRGLWGALQGKVSIPAAGYAAYMGLNPWLLPPALAAQSPRLMGEFSVLSGQAGRNLGKLPWRQGIYAGRVAGSPYTVDANQ